MWQDYEATYKDTLQDPDFLAWREWGARRKADNIRRVCRGLTFTSVVEIGCGTGAVLRLLHDSNFAQNYFCCDVSPSAMAFVRSSCPALAEHATVAPAEALPFPDSAFDLAILSHVIEHLENPLVALREASRVARFVLVEVPTEKVAINVVRTRILGKPYPSIAGAGHVQFWSPASAASFLEAEAHLEIISRHQDLLDDEFGIDHSNGHEMRQLLKRALRGWIPSSIYARLVTTHATFLCRPRFSKVAESAAVSA